jgi:hypothetical protein
VARPLYVRAERAGATALAAWTRALRMALAPRPAGGDVAVVPVVALPGIPRPFRAAVCRLLPRDPEAWALLDWDRALGRARRRWRDVQRRAGRARRTGRVLRGGRRSDGRRGHAPRRRGPRGRRRPAVAPASDGAGQAPVRAVCERRARRRTAPGKEVVCASGGLANPAGAAAVGTARWGAVRPRRSTPAADPHAPSPPVRPAGTPPGGRAARPARRRPPRADRARRPRRVRTLGRRTRRRWVPRATRVATACASPSARRPRTASPPPRLGPGDVEVRSTNGTVLMAVVGDSVRIG